jgi:thiol-disulfide isomerase/thioredoxin
MVRIILIFFLLIRLSDGFSQKADIISLPDLEEIINQQSNDIKVINFWATWCRPCVKELPYIDNLSRNIEDKKIDVVLVSLDFAEDFEKKLLPFLQKREIKSQVKLLDETNYDYMIDRIDESWSGAIPATLIIDSQTGRRIFLEKELGDGELEQIISNFIKNS